MEGHKMCSIDTLDPTTSTLPILDPAGDRFGEQLARIVNLSRHDVYDILAEQATNHKRFGQIALAMGLCQVNDLWQAWTMQTLGRTPHVDLGQFGIDAQATSEMPAWLASAVQAVPVRSTGDRLVVAASEKSLPRAIEAMAGRSHKSVSFVIADAKQISQAYERYYAHTPAGEVEAVCQRRCGSKCKGEACPMRLTVSARADRSFVGFA